MSEMEKKKKKKKCSAKYYKTIQNNCAIFLVDLARHMNLVLHGYQKVLTVFRVLN